MSLYFSLKNRRCRLCEDLAAKKYRSSLKGFLQGLIIQSRNRAKKPKTIARQETSIHNLTKEILFAKYADQQGKCYYSGIKMNHTHNTDWMMRLNNSLGYTSENTVLCCHEFNSGQNQWTLQKITEIKELITTPINLVTLTKEINEAKYPPSKAGIPKKKYIKEISDDGIMEKCHLCENFYLHDHFIVDVYLGCKLCRKKQKGDYMSTLRGFLTALVGAARSRTTKSNNNGIFREFSISTDDVFELILSQAGRCFYSCIPLVFKIKSDWICSIERLNNKLGYTKNNIILICNEFNTTDLTSLAKDKNLITGSGQWSTNKFAHFISHLANE